ncbi:MAG: helix-turn-helix domain-containing protein [Synergistaceae bacterium]|nr:helix-turn-helix domain-containing protein [Synergistaceae bacterium]MBQ3625127.1 helix-turn-helix domain-containing protein [Synergistaceae bacterium]MBQ6739134.1 helix-turn-helix domain-containing protein [Synergistaceae bacterium]MBQ6908478.1 helix-turn-helix domain-containing protein [Synergistaceae bacterium]MBR0043310.1 helix-turn-helix domain-containing protein [Synergistaceae bacterium]
MIDYIGENLISITEAMQVMGLSRAQIVKLCTAKRLNAKKIGGVWVIERNSAEHYKPAPRGFAVVWQRRRAQEAALNNEIKLAVEQAAK